MPQIGGCLCRDETSRSVFVKMPPLPMKVEAIEPFSITIGDMAVFTVFEHNSAEGFLISCEVVDRWFELWIKFPDLVVRRRQPL